MIEEVTTYILLFLALSLQLSTVVGFWIYHAKEMKKLDQDIEEFHRRLGRVREIINQEDQL